jgi:hypothetical protein
MMAAVTVIREEPMPWHRKVLLHLKQYSRRVESKSVTAHARARWRCFICNSVNASFHRNHGATGIDDSPENTNDKETAFFTEPPVTEEVFSEYSKIIGKQNIFRRKGDLLVTTQAFGLDKQYLDQTEEFLTDAERQIEHAKTRKGKQYTDRLKSISEGTGRPIGKPVRS